MKSWLNCLSCLGCLIFLVGGFLIAAGFMGGWGTGSAAVGSLVTLIGFVIFYLQVRTVGKWNKVIGIAKSQNEITVNEISSKSGVPANKVQNIIYEGIASGEITGTIEGDTFSRGSPSATIETRTVSETTKVLVICPYCGAKTEQGLTKCQKCGGDI